MKTIHDYTICRCLLCGAAFISTRWRPHCPHCRKEDTVTIAAAGLLILALLAFSSLVIY